MSASHVLVCGGRDYKDLDLVFRWLNVLSPTVVVHGGCPTGADKFASEWVEYAGAYETVFFANWDAYGKAAGPSRNLRMGNAFAKVKVRRKLVLAFPGGRGTAHMLRTAGDLHLATVQILGPGSWIESHSGILTEEERKALSTS